MNHSDEIIGFINKIKSANRELAKKELFLSLLNQIYSNDHEAVRLIAEINLGAEFSINIPLENRLKTGSADTQYRNIIIEFENDLKKTGPHAVDQLKEYYAGNVKTSKNYDFVLIATDCLTWKIYIPDYENLIDNPDFTNKDIKLEEKDVFVLNDKTAENFFYFLDHYIFRTQAQKPTYQNIKNDFGEKSNLFIGVIQGLFNYYRSIKEDTELRIAYDQWQLFLSIAYGKFQGNDEVYLIHTYLSIFSKLLAYSVLTKNAFIDDDTMQDILKGEAFIKLKIENFIEKDFFQWIAKDEHYGSIKHLFRKIAVQISDYNFNYVDEDILKGVYQELIDTETKHRLGEYYTPDWLAKMVVDNLPIKKDSYVLDPSCGSGTFLRAVIDKKIQENRDIKVEDILEQIAGIDIHPLSVQISKTTILLSISKLIKKIKKPVKLPVYMANTLHIPEEMVNLFENHFYILINNKKYSVSKNLINDPVFFDNVITFCENIAKWDIEKPAIVYNEFQTIFKNKLLIAGIDAEVLTSAYNIYLALKEAIDNKQDSIWGYILKNTYKPVFLKAKFDFVVGNPPWLTYRDVNNVEYQTQLRTLAATYDLVQNIKNIPNLELAAIFLAHCSSSFLKEKGKIAFVLPRGILSADHHDNTRKGKSKGFRITDIWDLKDVQPLFNITSCVIFADKKLSDNELSYKKDEISGKVFKGKIKDTHLPLSEIEKSIEAADVIWNVVKMQKMSAFSTKDVVNSDIKNHYFKNFTNGATLIPRNFYFVEFGKDVNRKELKDAVFYAKTSEDIIKDAKMPWKEITLKGNVNGEFIFKTILSKYLISYAYFRTDFVHLPVVLENDRYKMIDWREIRLLGKLESAKWFNEVERHWDENKTEKSKDITYLQWLNYQNKITGQKKYNFNVIYSSSGNDAVSAVIDTKNKNSVYVIDYKTYWGGTNDKEEAYYLSAFLNSQYANKRIKDFQSTGLFGARDICKKILEVPLPEFDGTNKKHLKIAEIAMLCEKKSYELIANTEPEKQTQTNLRKKAKELLKTDMEEIDKLLSAISQQ